MPGCGLGPWPLLRPSQVSASSGVNEMPGEGEELAAQRCCGGSFEVVPGEVTDGSSRLCAMTASAGVGHEPSGGQVRQAGA